MSGDAERGLTARLRECSAYLFPKQSDGLMEEAASEIERLRTAMKTKEPTMTLRRVAVMAGDGVWRLWVEVDKAQAVAMDSMVESGCELRLDPLDRSGVIWDCTRRLDWFQLEDIDDLAELIDELCSQWDTDRHADWGRRFDDTI